MRGREETLQADNGTLSCYMIFYICAKEKIRRKRLVAKLFRADLLLIRWKNGRKEVVSCR